MVPPCSCLVLFGLYESRLKGILGLKTLCQRQKMRNKDNNERQIDFAYVDGKKKKRKRICSWVTSFSVEDESGAHLPVSREAVSSTLPEPRRANQRCHAGQKNGFKWSSEWFLRKRSSTSATSVLASDATKATEKPSLSRTSGLS